MNEIEAPPCQTDKLSVRVIDRSSLDWEQAEYLVQQTYRRRFDAVIQPNPDRFAVVFRDQDGCGSEMLACAGIKFGEKGKLFSEQYLDEPIEVIMQRQLCEPVPRNSIVEIGALASTGRKAGSELVRLLPMIVWCLGHRFALCTATGELQLLFRRFDINFTPLRDASVNRLPTGGTQTWGSYYDRAPQAGFIRMDLLWTLFVRNTGRYQVADIAIDINTEAEGRSCVSIREFLAGAGAIQAGLPSKYSALTERLRD
jgi:hypothetical protein